MSGYCCDCNAYKCRCKRITIDEVIADMDCRLERLEKLLCKTGTGDRCLEIITSVEMPFEVDGAVVGAAFTVSGDVGYTVYAYQPKLPVLNTCNDICGNPYGSIYNSWGEVSNSTVLNGVTVSGTIPISLGNTVPVVYNEPLVRSLCGITEIILENITITRPVIDETPPSPVDVVIGRVPPIARPVNTRVAVLYDREAGINYLGFPNDPTTNSIGNIINRIELVVSVSGRIILRITFRYPQTAPLHPSYTSTTSVSVRYNISQPNTPMV